MNNREDSSKEKNTKNKCIESIFSFFRKAVPFWFLLISFIIILIVEFVLHTSSCIITEESLVITFIGILVTFLVVSNKIEMNMLSDKIEKYKDLGDIKKLKEYVENMKEYYDTQIIAQDLIDAQGKDITITGISFNGGGVDQKGNVYPQEINFKIKNILIDGWGRVCYNEQTSIKGMLGSHPFGNLTSISINGKNTAQIATLCSILSKLVEKNPSDEIKTNDNF